MGWIPGCKKPNLPGDVKQLAKETTGKSMAGLYLCMINIDHTYACYMIFSSRLSIVLYISPMELDNLLLRIAT